ncbi:MAG: DUF2842 domain-containing protein [Parvularculaceae bacterium]|nr:DUF2842 domain-containing protein [Parvularculaceae bacterium]
MARLYIVRSAAATDRPPHGASPLPPRIRKLVAMAVLLPALLAYALGAILLAERIPAVWWLQLVYFAVAGVAWAFPARILLRWAERGGPHDN